MTDHIAKNAFSISAWSLLLKVWEILMINNSIRAHYALYIGRIPELKTPTISQKEDLLAVGA